MRRVAVAIVVAVVLAAWWATAPPVPGDDLLPEYVGEADAGERIFWAGGCASCHAGGEDKLLLGGGVELESPYGTFIAPNISPHETDGIGQWTAVVLSADNRRQLWIPPGYAHGFAVLGESAEVQYKATAPYAPDSEASVLWSDRTLGIEWPVLEDAIVSEKDRSAPTLGNAQLMVMAP